jgi:hypothetical protein
MILCFLVWAPARALAEEWVVPCAVGQIAVAGDGSGIWVVCKAQENEVYWVAGATGAPVRILKGGAGIEIFAAPLGSQAVVVVSPRSGRRQAVLYDKETRVKELPIDASFALWGADGHRIYFYGGSSVPGEAWDILGIYVLESGAIARTKLHEATEIVRVCAGNGNLYAVTPAYPGFAGNTTEYTAAVKFVREVHGWIGGIFSAKCTYVASEYSYHGPLPWDIYEVKSGKSLYHFPALDDEVKGGVYAPVAWNPKEDSLLLREYFQDRDADGVFQVFDARSGKVLRTLPGGGAVAWSADGASVFVAEGQRVVSYLVRREK